MNKNFIQYQASAIKELIELLNYSFTSNGTEYKLIDFVKTQLIEKGNTLYVSDILLHKTEADKYWFTQNIVSNYIDALYSADDFDNVVVKFVSLYNTYIFYNGGKEIISYQRYSSNLSFDTDDESTFDTQFLAFNFNQNLSAISSNKAEQDFDEQNVTRYNALLDVFVNKVCFNNTLIAKGFSSLILSEPLRTMMFNQGKLSGIIPLRGNFTFTPEHSSSQVRLDIGKYYEDGDGYVSNIPKVAAEFADNNVFIKKNAKTFTDIKAVSTAHFNAKYIAQINKQFLLKARLDFYAVSSVKDKNELFVNSAVNIVFNKERTVSAVVSGYEFYLAVFLLCSFDTDDSFDIYLDDAEENVYLIGNRLVTQTVATGFNPITEQIEYGELTIPTILVLPTISSNYPSLIDEVWMFSFSKTSSLKDILDFSKEEDISKIIIPTEFLNQKDIVTKEQKFKIDTIESRIEKSKKEGKELVDYVVGLADDYIQTYATKKVAEFKNELGETQKNVEYFVEPTASRFFINGNIDYDYVWKVNELFWRYNKAITVRELVAYFIAKGDSYNYRLLSYRILGIDCYSLKTLLTEQLLIEGLLCVDELVINNQTKSIETPLKVVYKYEYAIGNYYEKRRKLNFLSEKQLENLTVYPMAESIKLLYGDDLGQTILLNQQQFLDNDFVKPQEMAWFSKSKKTLLMTQPLDSVMIDNQRLKIEGYEENIFEKFYDFVSGGGFTTDGVTASDLLYGYILRLPESFSIPLKFIQEFNCYKIGVLPKEHPKATSKVDVFAVFGAADTKSENPLFIGSATDEDTCKEYIQNKNHNGSIAFRRNIDKKTGRDKGTYAFSKSLSALERSSYTNLLEGGFITQKEYDSEKINLDNKKKIVEEILIAYNLKLSKVIAEGDIMFNKFMQTVDKADAVRVQRVWNERYNFLMHPKKYLQLNGSDEYVLKLDNDKFPIFIEHSRYFKDKTNREFALNPNQYDGIKFHVSNNNRSLLAHEVGFGKALKINALVLSAKGWVRNGDLKVGDEIISVDGLPTKVLGVYPQGKKDLYKITFDDGASVECCDEHLWSVTDTTRKWRSGDYLTLSTKQLMDKNLQLSISGKKHNANRSYKFKTYYKDSNGRNRWQIPVVEPVHFDKQDLPIHPYLLGALLGDGTLAEKHSINFSSADSEMIEKLKLVLPNSDLRINRKGNSKYDYIISRPNNGGKFKNELVGFIKQLNLNGKKSHNKFIPEIYKFNSVENRIALLNGLMDTDGTSKIVMRKGAATPSSALSYCTISKQLRDDVIFLVRSLGGVATVYNKKSTYSYKGEKKKGQLAYIINISLPPAILPFTLERKLAKHIPKHKYLPNRSIANIELVGNEEAQCIKVAHPSELFVTEDFIVTHNTTSAICMISHAMLTGQANRILVCVPNPTYINWANEMKGQKTNSGTPMRGIIPHINLVELKNARKDVFIKYDKKTFTQTGGIKLYSKSQIQNIHVYSSSVSEVIAGIKKIKLYFTNFSGNTENIDNFIEFTEQIFDKKITDWRSEPFFSNIFNDIKEAQKTTLIDYREKTSGIESDRTRIIDRITNDSKLIPAEKSAKIKLENEKADKNLSSIFEKFSSEFTNEVIGIIKSSANQIYDYMGVYDECFLTKHSVVICTHQAIGQIRLDKKTALQTSYELKGDRKYAKHLANNSVGFESLEIDGAIVDEIHNFNELFSKSERQISHIETRYRKKGEYFANDYDFNYFESMGSAQVVANKRGSSHSSIIKYNLSGKSTDLKKATLFGMCKYLQNKSGEDKNIMLLSATPFVDDLFQMVGVFNMINKFPMPFEFFSTYMYQDWDWENNHKGETVLKVQTSNFKNDEARNNWIRLFSQFVTFDVNVNKDRPNKFIYPFDCKYSATGTPEYIDNCNTNVFLDFTKEQYEIYKNIGKFVDGLIPETAIVKAVPNTVIVKGGVYVDSDSLSIMEDMINETHEDYDLEKAADNFNAAGWIEVLSDKKHENYKRISDIYKVIESEYLLLTEGDESVSSAESDEVSAEDINTQSEFVGLGKQDRGTRTLQAQSIGKKLSVSPYMVTPDGAKDYNMVNADLPPLYGMDTAENILKSAINFVETSPKIYFTVQAIKCLVKHHIDNNEDISGQIIYMAWGQSFWYGGCEYNGMVLIKKYLESHLSFNGSFRVEETDSLSSSSSSLKCGVVKKDGVVADEGEEKLKTKPYILDQVQIVSGKSQDAIKKSAISKAFNKGDIKILIGSGTIKEGINLQGESKQGAGKHGSSTIYVLTAEYAPMAMMQLEGRIWRQGNPLENVRIVNPLIKNSVDSHVYSKLNEKIKKVKTMLEAGIYDFKETQFEKDIEGISLSLNTNIDEKIKIKWSKKEKAINEEKTKNDRVKTRLDNINKKYKSVLAELDILILLYNTISKAMQDYFLSGIIRAHFREESKRIKAIYTDKRNVAAELLVKEYEKDLAAWQKLFNDNEAINDANKKINEDNKKAIKEGKAVKIEPIELTADKPLKGDMKYIPDNTLLYAQEKAALDKAKEDVVVVNQEKLAKKDFENNEMYYYSELNNTMPFSEILSAVGKLKSALPLGGQLDIVDIDKGRAANSYSRAELSIQQQIDENGYYYLESRYNFLEYNYAMLLRNNPSLKADMMEALKKSGDANYHLNYSLFEKFLRLFSIGEPNEIVLSDYQTLLLIHKKTFADIPAMLDDFKSKADVLNQELKAKDKVAAKYRAEFLAEEQKIAAERENLTNMKEFVSVDVDKFCKTNKYIYLKGSLTDEQKQELGVI